MRITRLFAALMTLLLAASIPFLVSGGADAATKTTRTVTLTGKEPTPNHFVFKGTVEGNYNQSKVVIYQGIGGTHYKVWRTIKTNGNSTFKFIPADLKKGQSRVCYIAKVPSTHKYKTSASKGLCIIRE